eukprot:363979-Chlamydomonas_euryale.AAC.3
MSLTVLVHMSFPAQKSPALTRDRRPKGLAERLEEAQMRGDEARVVAEAVDLLERRHHVRYTALHMEATRKPHGKSMCVHACACGGDRQ